MSARRKRRPALSLSPQELRQRARRALTRGRSWLAKADDLLREADRRDAAADDERIGPAQWPEELCETCREGAPCALHKAHVDTGLAP